MTSRNTGYFRALEDNEMSGKLQSKPPPLPQKRNTQFHILRTLGYFSNHKRGWPGLTTETGEKWKLMAEHFPVLF